MPFQIRNFMLCKLSSISVCFFYHHYMPNCFLFACVLFSFTLIAFTFLFPYIKFGAQNAFDVDVLGVLC